MPLSAGTRLGPYSIESKVGAGGMGEVYRARDSRLDRTVAIKVLPAELANDADSRARFEREAKAISALQHVHICTLFDIGNQDSIEYLVMEYLEGETLAARLARGPLLPQQVLSIGAEIASGLARAHRQGIIHRDLKPGNIMLTKSGAKLLDFGLAKAFAASGCGAAPAFTAATTMVGASAVTAAGTIVGTVQYMSPEQIQGRPADARSDLFSVGAVLYEMATGKRAFDGTSQISVAAAILEKEPEPMTAVQPLAPPALEQIVRRCLAKDPDERWQSAADLVFALQSAGAPSPPPVVRSKSRRYAPLVAVVLLLAIACIAAWRLAAPPKVARRVTRVVIPIGVGNLLFGDANFNLGSPPAISPDGKLIAYSTWSRSATESGIYLRPIDSFEAKFLEGTARGENPFFSPDGKWIAFATFDGLQKVPVEGGTAQKICDASAFVQGAWGPDGVIVFSENIRSGQGGNGLLRVAESGGKPQVLTTLDAGKGERAHAWPVFLPDGDTVLFGIRLDNAYQIDAVSLRTGQRRKILENAASPMYSAAGYLLYQAAGGSMAAVPFDARHAQVHGRPIKVADDVLDVGGFEGKLGAAVSNDGTLIYLPSEGHQDMRTVAWIDRKGAPTPLVDKEDFWIQPRFSPDGRQLVLRKVKTECELWLYDFDRKILSLFAAGADNHDPVWTPDGKRITYDIPAGSPIGVVWKAVDGSAPPELLFKSDQRFVPLSWSPDGRTLLLLLQSRTTKEIWSVTMDGERHPVPLLTGASNHTEARFSPDGRYIAYTSDESGRAQVYIRPWPGPGAVTQVSADGGNNIAWSRNGRELFFVNEHKFMKVDVTLKPGLQVRAPVQLFDLPVPLDFLGDYDAAPDGKRLVMTRRHGAARSELLVVLNWDASLN